MVLHLHGPSAETDALSMVMRHLFFFSPSKQISANVDWSRFSTCSWLWRRCWGSHAMPGFPRLHMR